jgi:hypothetical protein
MRSEAEHPERESQIERKGKQIQGSKESALA